MAEQDQSITINVKTLDAKTFSLTVPNDIEVTELKKRICEHSNAQEAGLRVIFQGKVLKDGTKITAYGIKSGHTVHMVQRPPGAEPPASGTNAAPQPQAQPTNAPRNPMMGPGVMLGSITIPDGTPAPNINQILGPVFSSLGLPPTLLSNLPQQPQANRPGNNPDEARRQVETLVNTLTTGVTSLEQEAPSPSPSTTEAPSNPNNAQTLGNLLSQVDSQSMRLHPYIVRLASLLQQETTLESAEMRNEAQMLSRQLGNLMQQLGVLQIVLSSSLSTLQMGTTPSQAQVEPPGHQQRHVITPTSNITIHIQNDVSQPTTTQQRVGIPVSVPMFTLNPRNAPNPNNNATPPTNTTTSTTPTTAPTTTPQQQPSTTPTSNTTQPNTNQQQQPVNPLQNIFAMLNQQRPPANPPTTTPANPPTTNPNPLAQMMQSLLQPGQLQNMMQAVGPMMQQLANNPNMTQMFDAHNRAQVPTGNPATSTVVPTPTNIPNQATSALMSQTYQAVNQALNAPQAPSVSTVIGNISGGPSDEEEGALQEILQKILDNLTIPDMMSVMGGNWAPIQRVHPVLESYIRNDLLNGDTSDNALEKLTDDIMDSINESMGENNLHADIKRRVKPGYEITSIARHIFRKYISKLLRLVITPSSPSTNNPHPFALQVKEWTLAFVGELVSHLSTALNGGVNDTSILINYYLQERLLFLGPEFSQMATNMVTSYIMNTYSQSSQAITSDPSTWTTTISVDEIRQQNTVTKPLSDSYQDGSSKKRKSPSAPVANVDMAVERLKESLEGKEEEDEELSNDKEAIEAFARSNLPSKYLQFIKKELKDKISRDPDYDPKKFPNSSSL